MVPAEPPSPEHRELLLELSLLIAERRGVDELFAAFAEHVSHGITFDYASLFVSTPDQNFIRSVGQRPELWSEAAPGTIHRAAAMGQTQIEGSVDGSEYIPRFVDVEPARRLNERGFERAWVTPLIVDGENYGMLTVAKLVKGRFPEAHIAFLRDAARLLARAVRQDFELERARLTAARAQAASELILALQAHEPYTEIFERLPALLEHALDVDYLGLVINGRNGFALEAEAPAGVHLGIAADPGATAFAEELATRHEFIQFQPGDGPSAGLLGAGYARSGVGFLRDGNEVSGLLVIGRKGGRKFDSDEERFIGILRSILAQALANERRLERTETAAARALILNEVALLVNAGEAIETIFERLMDLLDKALEIGYLGLVKATGDPELFVQVGSRPEMVRPAGALVTLEALGFSTPEALEPTVSQYRLANWADRTDFGRASAAQGLQRSVTVVIRQGSEALGFLTLARADVKRFSADEEAFLETLSAMLGQAIANQRRLLAAQAEAVHSRILSELALLLNNGEPIEAHFQRLRELLSEGVGFDFCAIAVRIPETDQFRVMRSEEVAGRERETAPIHAAAVKEILATGRFSGQYLVEPTFAGAPVGMFELGIERGASFVLTTGREPEGLLTIGRRTPAPFRTDEMAFFEVVASLLANVAANERRLWLAAQEAGDQSIVAEAAAAVARQSEPTPITLSLRQTLGRFIPNPFVRFASLEPEGLAFHTLSGERDAQPMGVYFAQALASGQSVVPPPAERETRGESVVRTRAARLESHILTRADSAGTPVGFLLAGSRDASFVAGERELRLCRAIAGIVGPAMANARAAERERAEAEEQAIIAAAAAAVAGEIEPLAIVRGLRDAVGLFIPQPFTNFGYLEGDRCEFPTKDGGTHSLAYGPRFHEALIAGQAIVPNSGDRTDEWVVEPQRVGLEAHIATRAMSGGSVIGLLVVGSRDPAFTPRARELRLCRLIADMIGPAMANARAVLRERQEAEDQAIIARAAAAAARETTPLAIVRGIRAAVGQFIPMPFVNFGYRDPDGVRFPSRDGLLALITPDKWFTRALEDGYAIVPSTNSRREAGEAGLDDLVRLGIQAHVLTRTMSAGSVAGLLAVGSRDPAFLPGARELRLCRLIADIVGPAMANARAIERERHEAEEQRILAQAAAVVAASPTESALIEALQQPIRELIPQSELVFVTVKDGVASQPGGVSFDVGPVGRRALGIGQMVTGAVHDGAPAVFRNFVRDRGFTRWVYTVANSGGDALGLFLVATSDPAYEFSERDLRFLRLMADFATPALANLRESARRQREADDQRVLAEAAAALAAGATELEILKGLVAPVRRFVPRARVAFSYVDGGEMMRWDGRHRRPIHALAREALDSGQVLGTVRSEMTEESRNLMASVGVQHFCDTTAVSAGAPIGLLWVGSPDPAFEFDERARGLLRLIAGIAGPAMANARADRRQREDAEDERILAEIAAVAARGDAANLLDSLPAALANVIPAGFAHYGFIDGEYITYHRSLRFDAVADSAETVVFALGAAGREALALGQAVGTLPADTPGLPVAAVGLQKFALTTYATGGGAPGALVVATRDNEFAFCERTLALLRRVAQIVGPAVESARAQGERARQAELYALILRSLSEGVILSDGDGNVVFANDLGREIVSALDPGSRATTVEETAALLPEEARAHYLGVFSRGEAARGRTSFEVDGQPGWFDYQFVPLNDPVTKLLAVISDVTADVARQAEEENRRAQMAHAQRLAALGELIGGVAHELNNPLTAILGFAEVMALSPAAGPLSEELEIVRKEALRARNIVRDLLFIVRPGATERSLVAVEDLVNHIVRLRKAGWAQMGIAWEAKIQPGCTVWGDEQQLTQVLLNLVTNAEQALASAPVRRLTIRAVCSGDSTVLSIIDSGAGMDEATSARVFEPFFTTKQGLGTGLGLPLSYSIIQSHGGEIALESRPGEGTTFTVTLPALRGAEAPGGPSAAALVPGKTRVLVVDDEPSLRKVCQRLIASMGHECTTAENSATAIALAGANDFDVVLCDYRLATETADTVIAGFERVAPHLVARTIIATGATSDAGVVSLTERHGLRLMAKPYGREELAAVIEPARVSRRE